MRDRAHRAAVHADAHGAFKSTDGGGTWIAVNTAVSNTYVSVLAADPATPTTRYAGTDAYGVFKSTDAGNTWTFGKEGSGQGVN